MDRRTAITTFGVGLLGGAIQVEAKEPVTYFSGNDIFIHLYVGNLRPFLAEGFCERVKDQLVKVKPENSQIILIPQRLKPTYVEVFGDGEKLESFLHEVDNISIPFNSNIGETKEEVRDFVMISIGAPVKAVTEDILTEVNRLIDVAFEHQMIDKKKFVLNEILQNEQIVHTLDRVFMFRLNPGGNTDGTSYFA